MGATRKQLLRVMERGGACGEAMLWVKETPGTPRELWSKCKRQDWMEWLVLRLADWGGEGRWDQWHDFLVEHCREMRLCVCGQTLLQQTPRMIRKHVPWHMVDAAIQREGSQ